MNLKKNRLILIRIALWVLSSVPSTLPYQPGYTCFKANKYQVSRSPCLHNFVLTRCTWHSSVKWLRLHLVLPGSVTAVNKSITAIKCWCHLSVGRNLKWSKSFERLVHILSFESFVGFWEVGIMVVNKQVSKRPQCKIDNSFLTSFYPKLLERISKTELSDLSGSLEVTYAVSEEIGPSEFRSSFPLDHSSPARTSFCSSFRIRIELTESICLQI